MRRIDSKMGLEMLFSWCLASVCQSEPSTVTRVKNVFSTSFQFNIPIHMNFHTRPICDSLVLSAGTQTHETCALVQFCNMIEVPPFILHGSKACLHRLTLLAQPYAYVIKSVFWLLLFLSHELDRLNKSGVISPKGRIYFL
ncbi:hypothetical protein GYMLUDRAFT_719335 [Collybiopsis luxurians FD-317 M1]|nr:hypothetical protein GYMLUDRAFT_719335 [Collybiopsis luxurians FD-317 M1]